jgi:hypothetical protein
MTRRRTLACTLLAGTALLGGAPALADEPVRSSASFVCVLASEDREGNNSEGLCVWVPKRPGLTRS